MPETPENRPARDTYTEHGPKDANPCRECGMSDWWCLYDINRGAGRCCIWCGLADVHGVLDPAPDTDDYDPEADFAATGSVRCDDCGARVRPRTLESLPEHGCTERQRARQAASQAEED